MHILINGFIVVYAHGNGLRLIAVSGIGDGISATLDGTVIVARRQMRIDMRAALVVSRNENGGFNRLACCGIGDGAVNPVEALLHVT